MISLITLSVDCRTPMDQTGLESLLLDMTRGDQEALAQLYHRTRTAVFGLTLSYLKNRHDAEDVTQDTFVRAWENAPSYRPQGKPMAWLLTIARNLSLMKLREKDRTESLPEEDWALPGPDDALTTEDRTVLSAAMSAQSIRKYGKKLIFPRLSDTDGIFIVRSTANIGITVSIHHDLHLLSR